MFKKIKNKAKELKQQLVVLTIAYKDKRTPAPAKILIGLTVGYLLSPIDIIPDFIPVLGILDDLIIVPMMITASIKMIPEEVMADARNYADANPTIIKKNNWWFAIIIILIWALIIVAIIQRLRSD